MVANPYGKEIKTVPTVVHSNSLVLTILKRAWSANSGIACPPATSEAGDRFVISPQKGQFKRAGVGKLNAKMLKMSSSAK
jgi:hypothetical protein